MVCRHREFGVGGVTYLALSIVMSRVTRSPNTERMTMAFVGGFDGRLLLDFFLFVNILFKKNIHCVHIKKRLCGGYSLQLHLVFS